MDSKPNAILAQSGGPTAVINSSACGVIQEAKKSGKIGAVYGAINGIIGVLKEDLFDLSAEKGKIIEALKQTPAAAMGSCRYKLKSLEQSKADFQRVIDVFKAHNIHYFFYAGGNDSMDTADKLSKMAAELKYDLIVMGVPKTIDNDLAITDHCPGFGSVAKYVATTVMEAGKDTDALYSSDTATVVETMGRNAGWIAAAAGCAARSPEDAPHLVYMPEAPLSLRKFEADVRGVLERLGRCVIAVSEGVKDEKGNHISEVGGAFAKDAFGHAQLGGAGDALASFVENTIKVKCRRARPGTAQREAMHFASLTDVNEAYMVGQKAVQHAVAGTSGFMVTLVRESTKPYRCTTGMAKLSDIANGEKLVPREWINAEGNHITQALRDYITPLMHGEAPVEIGPDGLPVYMRFQRNFLDKKCGPWQSQK